jgi:hypothetical protein
MPPQPKPRPRSLLMFGRQRYVVIVSYDVDTLQDQQWLSPVVKSEMGSLLAVRDAVMSLVEEARAAKSVIVRATG